MIARTLFHRALTTALLAVLALSPALAGARDKNKDNKKTGPASTSLEEYLKSVRAAGVEQPSTTGSLWVSTGPLSNVTIDYKAHLVGDLIVVQLADQFTANTGGENKTSRQFNTQTSISGLVGQIGAKNRLQNLLNANSNTALDGKGQSTMNSNLHVSLAGRVVEVLPNGVMVIEAVRDFTVGNDRQTMVLHGLVRPGDLTPDNSVLSSKVTSIELEIKGKGAVADATRQPNLIIRLLLKILSI
jgi:flagellar L-ring protein precursor FlgH